MARTIAGQPGGRDPLGPNQEAFAAELAAKTGLDLNVIRAWVHAEQPYDDPATGVMPYNDWLNIGWTDKGRTSITYAKDWNNPKSAADRTAEWLKGTWGGQFGYRAAGSITAILRSVTQPPAEQIQAIQESGWASSGYPQLAASYAAVTGAPVVGGPVVSGRPRPGSGPAQGGVTGSGGGAGVFGAIEGGADGAFHAVEGGIESLWGDVTSTLDFLKAILWLVNPLTWLRGVEALFGFVLILAGVFVALGADRALQGTPAGAVAEAVAE